MNRLTEIITATAALAVRDAEATAAGGRVTEWCHQLLGEVRGLHILTCRLASEMEPNAAQRCIRDLRAAINKLEALRRDAVA